MWVVRDGAPGSENNSWRNWERGNLEIALIKYLQNSQVEERLELFHVFPEDRTNISMKLAVWVNLRIDWGRPSVEWALGIIKA